MSEHHLYTKKEISNILKKASEIQTQKELYGDREGLNEQELVDLAKEVGIDKSSLLEALNTLNDTEFNDSYNWLKGTSRVQRITHVDGEINEELWDEVVQEIRKINGGIGKLSHVGSSFEWEQRMQEIGYRHISFTPQKGKTKIQYVSSWAPLRFISLFMTAFMGGVLTLILLKGVGIPKSTAVFFTPIGGLVGLLSAMTFLKFRFEKEKKKLQAIIGSISKKIRGVAKPEITIEEDAYEQEEHHSSPSKVR